MIKNTLRKSPLVSVIIPVYNDKKYLDETIRSILNQTFKDLELILINDASTDKSLAIMKSYQKKDKRIILINNKKNLMTSTSRNKALKIARGKYIVIEGGEGCGKTTHILLCKIMTIFPYLKELRWSIIS